MASATILEQILADKAQEVATAKKRRSLADLEAVIREIAPGRPFVQSLADKIHRQQPAVIAEIKKASPSRGLIREDFEPAAIAQDYESNGATCLSVLTDEKYFQGCPDYLIAARNASALPVLRKDFMIDPYQVAEAKAMKADCILLIVAALQQTQMQELAAYANELSIDILVEVHDRDELDRALLLDIELIGINNRNLHTFSTSLDTTLQLAQHIPADKLIVTESGISSAEDVRHMTENGIYGFLVGESCMTASSPGAKLKELLSINEAQPE